MKLSLLLPAFVTIATQITAHPQPATTDLIQRDAPLSLNEPLAEIYDLWKRKGGGGGGGKGGSSSGGSSSSSGGRSSSGGSSSSSSGRTTGSSNTGGATRLGSGPTRNYGGGRYYGGGAAQPYRPGSTSPRGLLAVPLVGAALLVYPGIWLYGAYAYPYGHPYTFHNRTGRRNRTATTTSAAPTATTVPRGMVARMIELVERQDDGGANETKPVTCLCAADASCGCDEPEDMDTYLAQIIGDGDYSTLNKSLVNIADINGTSTIILNGTLPNGTTAPGGEDDAVSGAVSSGVGSMAGYAVMAALVVFSVFLV